MIRKSLLLKLFDAAFMQRWNDKARPMEFTELDKQAHKMVIAYFLGKFEENTPGFDWLEIIEGGLFELLQRIVLTDLKPPIFHKIKADAVKYKLLNDWVYNELEPFIAPLGKPFCHRFRKHFSRREENVNTRILSAAHFYATKLEFAIIRQANPDGYDIAEIQKDLDAKQKKYAELPGIAQLNSHAEYRRFISLCGELRFQTRWSNLHRIPKTSVIGHLLFVAILVYLFSLEIGACKQRRINNYLTGLFHDLPEVLTRDIISPVKKSVAGLDDLIKEYEKELLEKEVYGLIPSAWHPEIKMFAEKEFETRITRNGKIKILGTQKTAASAQNPAGDASELINAEYNKDIFNPRDGSLVKAADELAAFIEAYVAIRNGSANQELWRARVSLDNKYQNEIKNIGGINFGEIYADFD
jgi:putative hydrolase of HD superfamily